VKREAHKVFAFHVFLFEDGSNDDIIYQKR
jgi:hypothetical protein